MVENNQKSIRHSRVGTKFRLKMTLLNFLIKSTQKTCFQTKKKKITIEFYIFKLIYILNSASTNHFDFWNKFPKKSILPVENTKK